MGYRSTRSDSLYVIDWPQATARTVDFKICNAGERGGVSIVEQPRRDLLGA
jgi:hypothetical protein